MKCLSPMFLKVLFSALLFVVFGGTTSCAQTKAEIDQHLKVLSDKMWGSEDVKQVIFWTDSSYNFASSHGQWLEAAKILESGIACSIGNPKLWAVSQQIDKFGIFLEKHSEKLGDQAFRSQMMYKYYKAHLLSILFENSKSAAILKEIIISCEQKKTVNKAELIVQRLALYSYGANLFAEGKYKEVVLALEARKSITEDSVLQGLKTSSIYQEMGFLSNAYLKLGDLQKADHYQQSAMWLLETNCRLDPSTEYANRSTSLMTAAGYFLQTHRTDSAAFYLYKSRPYIKRNSHFDLDYHKLQAEVAMENQNYQKAEASLKESLRISTDLYGKKHYQTSLVHKKMAGLYQQMNKNEKASAEYQTALSFFGTIKGKMGNPDIPSGVARISLFEILAAKTDFLGKMAQENPIDLSYSKAALESGTLAITLMDNIRTGFYSYADKMQLSEQAFPVIENAIAAAYRLSQEYPKEATDYHAQAFALSEKAKSLTMLEHLYMTDKIESHTDEQTIRNIQILRSEIAKLEQDIYDIENLSGRESPKLAPLKIQIFKSQRELADQLAHISQAPLQLQTEKNADPHLSWQNISQKLPCGTALIEYFYGNNCIYTFLLTKDKLQMYADYNVAATQEAISALRLYLTDHGKRLSDDRKKVFVDKMGTIRQHLLDAILPSLSAEGISRLFIVPDGLTSLIPFEAIPLTGKGSNFSNFDYLIKHYDCFYASSALLWLKQQDVPRAAQDLKIFAGFAPKYGTGEIKPLNEGVGRNLSSYHLPGAEKEVKQIAALVGGNPILGKLATKNHFIEQASKYRILHLSMHVFSDDPNPLFSKFIFATPTDNIEEADDDCFLFANELLGLQLNAEMAVLSACNTGFGTIKRGDGVQSLARAFSFAGVNAVVQSLWKAPDHATQQIISDFYRNLKKGSDKPAALRAAKLHWLESVETPDEANPYFWSTFVLYGNEAPLPYLASAAVRDYFQLGLLLALISGLLFGIFKQK